MKSRLTEHSAVVAIEHQVSSDLGGEVAILDLKAGVYYGLDEVGARIWELIQETRVVGQIQATILEEYDVEPERGKRDVLMLLQDLANEGLIEVKDEATA